MGGAKLGKLSTWVLTRTQGPQMRTSVYVTYRVSTDILYTEAGFSILNLYS